MSQGKNDFLKMAQPLAQRLIDHALLDDGTGEKITDVKLSISHLDTNDISVEKGAVTSVETGGAYSVEIRLYAGDKTIAFSQDGLDEDALKAAITENKKIIGFLPEMPQKRLLDPAKVYKGDIPDLDLYDDSVVTDEQLINYAKTAETTALSDDKIKTTRNTSISRSASHLYIKATNGLELYKPKTMYSALTSPIAQSGDEMRTGGEASNARYFADMMDPVTLGQNAAQSATSKLNATLPKDGNMPVILSPDAAVSFFHSIFSAIDGMAVYQNSTFAKGMVGQQLMNKGITIIDDPLVKRGLRSAFQDSAGIESKAITFIENGILKSYNMSAQEAALINEKPIGREDGPTNVKVLPGKQTVDELIADIKGNKEGVYIRGFGGGKVSVNDGTYSKQAHGHLIKDGKITDIAIDSFIVVGNLKDMFMNVTIANDTPDFITEGTAFAAPTARIDVCHIAVK